MAAFPYFPFYPADWISSPRNMCLTLAQQGAYMRLLCFCWSSGDCSLPGDPERLRALSTLDEHLFTDVQQMFVPHPTKKGFVTNSRLYQEWQKVQNVSEKRSQAGKKSGESRRTHVQHMLNKPRTKHEQTANISESDSSLHPKKDSEKKDIMSRSSRDFMQEAREVLQFLNAKSGRHFRAVDSTLKMIAARLKGQSEATAVDIQACKTLIVKKVREWGSDEKMAKYLRPETLFNRTKFESYLGEVSVCDVQTAIGSLVEIPRPVPAGGEPKPCSPSLPTGSFSNVRSLGARS